MLIPSFLLQVYGLLYNLSMDTTTHSQFVESEVVAMILQVKIKSNIKISKYSYFTISPLTTQSYYWFPNKNRWKILH
jgi:hypothetical protein